MPDYVGELGGGIRGLQVGIAEAYAFEGVDSEVVAVLTAAKQALAELGARFVPVVFPSIAEASVAWGNLCSVETAITHEATYPSRADETGLAWGISSRPDIRSAPSIWARRRSPAASSGARLRRCSRTSMCCWCR